MSPWAILIEFSGCSCASKANSVRNFFFFKESPHHYKNIKKNLNMD